MADSFDDPGFWLPSQFLTDDDILMDKRNINKNGVKPGFGHCLSFPTEFPYEFDSFDSFGFSSALSSPVESGVGSTEGESCDEEDFLAGLTRRLAQSSLLETQKLTIPGFTPDKTEKKWAVAGSPQSTLCGIGSWSGRSAVSGNGSPNGSSQVSSPPTTPFGGRNDTWELIYAAAGQVARLKMTVEEAKYNQSYNNINRNNHQGRGLLASPQILNPVHMVKKPLNSGFYSNQNLAHNLPQTNQFQHARPDQGVKQQCPSVWGRQVKASWSPHQHPQQQQPEQIQNRGTSVVYDNGRCGRPLGLPQSAWPPLQVQSQNQQPQQSGSGMRAVFLNGSGVKRESSGTGVFLPRRYGNPPESRKKSGCSTVLLPAKVVQALNLNFDDINGQTQPHFNTGFAPNYDAWMARKQALLAQQRRTMRPDGALSHEIPLPHDWTY